MGDLASGYRAGAAEPGGTRITGMPSLPSLTPARSSGSSFAGGGASTDHWTYDPALGAYYNQQTGQISDTAGGQPWQGFSWGGVNQRAGSAPGWQWDDQLGMFFNPETGEVSDNPAGGRSTGLASDFYTPATGGDELAGDYPGYYDVE